MSSSESARYAYCLFCETGAEQKVARNMHLAYPQVEFMPLMQEMHVSENGKKRLVRKVALPGYIFLYTSERMRFELIRSLSDAYKLLSYDDREAELRGGDLAFARFVYEHQGLLVCSKAMRAGDMCQIVSGPLLKLKGQIEAFDKHNRNCRVRLTFAGQVWRSWLPFDWVQPDRGD